MTISVIEDLANRSVYTQTTIGKEILRVFAVSGLTGEDYAKSASAIAATGIPALGAAHPTVTDTYVLNKTATVISTDRAVVEVAYGRPDPRTRLKLGIDNYLLAWRSATREEETNLDTAGNAMFNSYVGHIWEYNVTTNQRTESSPDYYIYKNEVLSRVRPQAVLSVTKYVASITAANITGLVGRVNDATWYGQAAKTWLCAAINAEPDEGGYWVTWDLQFDPSTWVYQSRLKDSSGGEPPEIAVDNGIESFDIYLTANFGTLIHSL